MRNSDVQPISYTSSGGQVDACWAMVSFLNLVLGHGSNPMMPVGRWGLGPKLT